MTKLKTNVTPFRGAVMGLTGLSLIFVIICTGTTHWVKTKEPIKTLKLVRVPDPLSYSGYEIRKAQVQTTSHSGIFKMCYKRTVKMPNGGPERTSSKCLEYAKMKLSCTCCKRVVQAFMITGILSYVAVFVAIFLAVFKEKSMNIVGGILLVSFIMYLIGLSIYSGDQKLNRSVPRTKIQVYAYGWSFIVGWLGAILALVAGVIAFVTAVKEAPSK